MFSHRPRCARCRVQRRRLSVACRCATAGARSREVHSATLGNSCTPLRDTSRAARTRRHGGELQTARGHRWVTGFYHTHRRDQSALEPLFRNGSKRVENVNGCKKKKKKENEIVYQINKTEWREETTSEPVVAKLKSRLTHAVPDIGVSLWFKANSTLSK